MYCPAGAQGAPGPLGRTGPKGHPGEELSNFIITREKIKFQGPRASQAILDVTGTREPRESQDRLAHRARSDSPDPPARRAATWISPSDGWEFFEKISTLRISRQLVFFWRIFVYFIKFQANFFGEHISAFLYF